MTDTFDPDEPDVVDPDRPHPYTPMQLARDRRCAECGRPKLAAQHVTDVKVCPDCGRSLNRLDRCPAGCLDHLDDEYLDPAPIITSRNRFGGRNR